MRSRWSTIAPAGRPVSLPAYPWQRKRYWLPDSRPNWRYEIAWEPQALPDDDTLPPSETERGADLERLAVSYAAKALEDLHGDAPAAGHFGCLLRRMRDAQSRDREGALPAHPEELAAALLRRYPEHRAEFDLLIRCGRELANVMRGKADALELLFPADSSSGAAAVYANSPVSRFYNRLVSKAALTACSGRRARVLEIGAGTGATTEALLEVLPANAEYVFTDVSRLLLSDAAARFRGRTNLRFRTLDIERDPAAQGFEASSFDLIVCANVLHATADLRASLRHIRSLLAPGGVFVLLEVVAPRLVGRPDVRPDRGLVALPRHGPAPGLSSSGRASMGRVAARIGLSIRNRHGGAPLRRRGFPAVPFSQCNHNRQTFRVAHRRR